jgi:hypothetical protein
MNEEDEHEEVLEQLDESISAQVTKGYDYFWSQNELCYDANLKVVRSDRPRVRPPTWFCFMNEDERERLTKEVK